MALNPSPSDREITNLYHEGSAQEPPARLDAAILSAARTAVDLQKSQKKSRRSSNWFGLTRTLQYTASLTLAVMLGLLVTRQVDIPEQTGMQTKGAAPESTTPTAPPPTVMAEARSARKSEQAPAPIERKVSRAMADSARHVTAPAVPAPSPTAMPSAAPTPFPAKPDILASAPPPARDESAPNGSAIAHNAEGVSATRIMAKTERAKSLERAEPVESAAAITPSLKDAAIKSPQDWLADISRLLDQEKGAEARRSAEAFQKTYPDHPLPEALKKRLATAP